jgi:1-acyl-sn-glycerol-3-phosphate acyltransferase
MVNRAVSIAFWVFFGVSSLVCFTTALLIWMITFPFDRDHRCNHMFSCVWATLYAVAYPGWRVSVRHRERIPPRRAYVIVANHTSIADIILLFGLFKQFKWVSKKSVFKLPLIGWNMMMSGYVPLVRGDRSSIGRMMEESRRWLRRGISIMMFPEGTRSEDGQLKPFKHGAFSLALETGVSVVPIAIHGGHALIPKHSGTFAAKADLVVEVLDAIPPDGFTEPDAYAEAARTAIRDALSRRLESAPAIAESPVAGG